MNPKRFVTPATEDGTLTDVERSGPLEFRCVARFDVPDHLVSRLDDERVDLVFAARSRICRLGIAINPVGPFRVASGKCTAHFTGTIQIPSPGLAENVWHALTRGFPIGRLVLRDKRRRLGAEQVIQAHREGLIHLPKNFSLMSDGRVVFPPQLAVYNFRRRLSRHDVLKILTHPDGKEYLDAIQTREPVPAIILNPGSAVIAACAMFLSETLLVLDTEANGLAQHMHARVLDPIQTRSARVFLEFVNTGQSPIVNPTAVGALYRADGDAHPRPTVVRKEISIGKSLRSKLRSWRGDHLEAASTVTTRNLGSLAQNASSWEAVLVPNAEGRPPTRQRRLAKETRPGAEHPVVVPRGLHKADRFRIVHDSIAAIQGKTASVYARSLPGVAEHAALLPAMATGAVDGLVLANAAIDNDLFFSETDLSHLHDYLELGVGIRWPNPALGIESELVRKNRRAFFARTDALAELEDALVVAVYGSAAPLTGPDRDNFFAFLKSLADLAGHPLGILTGGGGGVMEAASRFAKRIGALVGANFLEGADALMSSDVAFYQMFQSGARHMRQRWFDVARFHVFCVGGIGTLEEIGLTLTDIKLGLLPTEPIILFGSSESGLYWSGLKEQLRQVVKDGRGPEWLQTHVLATKDPAEAISFVYSCLEIG